MPSEVHFLPWKERVEFPSWIEKTEAFKIIKEHMYTAVKIHFGEEGNIGYIRPEFVKPVAEGVKALGAYPFLTDANTIYVGQRADAVHHAIVADKHGFNIANCGCPVIIADGLRGNSGVNVEINLKHFKKVSVSNAVYYADAVMLMSHFKGHELTGFGGALKNAGMGCATRAGKYSMHDRLYPRADLSKCTACGSCVKWCAEGALTLKGKTVSFDQAKCVGCGECILSCRRGVFNIPWDEKLGAAQEKIVEYAYGTLKGKPNFSVNFVNFVTKYCDCYPTNEKPLMADIGIFACADPVALDQACADAVNDKFGSDFVQHVFPGIDWNACLDYAQKIGLGERTYRLVK